MQAVFAVELLLIDGLILVVCCNGRVEHYFFGSATAATPKQQKARPKHGDDFRLGPVGPPGAETTNNFGSHEEPL